MSWVTCLLCRGLYVVGDMSVHRGLYVVGDMPICRGLQTFLVTAAADFTAEAVDKGDVITDDAADAADAGDFLADAEDFLGDAADFADFAIFSRSANNCIRLLDCFFTLRDLFLGDPFFGFSPMSNLKLSSIGVFEFLLFP